MGKKKKTYVRPEMKIIEVKTEGVIAASGGEIEIPDVPDELISSLTSNCTKGGNVNQLKEIGDCIYFTVNYNPCSYTWETIKKDVFKSQPNVNIEYTHDLNGVKMYKVTINPTNPCSKITF